MAPHTGASWSHSSGERQRTELSLPVRGLGFLFISLFIHLFAVLGMKSRLLAYQSTWAYPSLLWYSFQVQGVEQVLSMLKGPGLDPPHTQRGGGEPTRVSVLNIIKTLGHDLIYVFKKNKSSHQLDMDYKEKSRETQRSTKRLLQSPKLEII